MSPRLIVLVICSETSALTRCGDLWEPPSIATGTIPCPEATSSSPRFQRAYAYYMMLMDMMVSEGMRWIYLLFCCGGTHLHTYRMRYVAKWFTPPGTIHLARRRKRWGRLGELFELFVQGNTSGWVAFWTRYREGTLSCCDSLKGMPFKCLRG